MPHKIKHKMCHIGKEFCLFRSLKNIILIQSILFILILNSCTFFSSRKVFEPLLTNDDVENIIQNVNSQNDIVSGFYSFGTLTINGWILDTSVDIFVAGKRDPLMLKMEISHSWGTPLFYLLIKDDRLEIRDFREKKQYSGKFTPDNLARFLPDMNWSTNMIWSFLRGYPQYSSYDRVYEGAPGVLTIEDGRKKRLGTITCSPGQGINRAVASPPRSFKMEFMDFIKTGDIDYAEKTVVEDIKGHKDLTFKRKKAAFNRQMKDEIFTLKNQPFFEVVSLDEM